MPGPALFLFSVQLRSVGDFEFPVADVALAVVVFSRADHRAIRFQSHRMCFSGDEQCFCCRGEGFGDLRSAVLIAAQRGKGLRSVLILALAQELSSAVL